MIVVLGTIAVLILASVIILQRFMKDMAIVEKELLKEIKEMKQCLIRINEKQLWALACFVIDFTRAFWYNHRFTTPA